MELDDTDKKILRELQGNLPVVRQPFLEVAERVGISEKEFFERVERLTKDGIIRKFGLRIDSKKVGFKSTLMAMKVAPDMLDETANKLSGYEFVTHNYARDHEYNLWFTVIERDADALKDAIERIKREVEFDDLLDLPVLQKFKINVRFDIK
ncbi:AsnC family transcriptional regulator [archaeon]|nr:AsnC family transcriptional regulator [archaeon]